MLINVRGTKAVIVCVLYVPDDKVAEAIKMAESTDFQDVFRQHGFPIEAVVESKSSRGGVRSQ